MTSPKDRRKRRSAAVLGFAVILFVLWSWCNGNFTELLALLKQHGTVKKTQSSSFVFFPWTTLGLSAQQREYLEEFRRPINFHGLVLDEKGHAVPDADVALDPVDNPSMSDGETPRSSHYSTKSDPRGRFSVVGMRGAFLYVRVVKDGYYSVPEEADGLFTHDSSDNIRRVLATTPTKPAVFILRKRGEPGKLIRCYGKLLKIGKSGASLDISLVSGELVANGHGDMRVELLAGAAQANDRYDWKCRISVPGGGLQIRKDDFDFAAPGDGYESEEVIQEVVSATNHWSTDGIRRYFVKTASKNYARINLRVITRGAGYLAIEDSYYNPTGSQNLEFAGYFVRPND